MFHYEKDKKKLYDTFSNIVTHILMKWDVLYDNNRLLKKCLSNAIGNANSIIGYKLAHFREQMLINVSSMCDL